MIGQHHRQPELSGCDERKATPLSFKKALKGSVNSATILVASLLMIALFSRKKARG
jgi:hypothetical protein